MRYLRSTHSAIVGKVTQHLHFWLFSRTAPVCTQDSHLHNSRAECPSWLALLRSLPKQPVLSTFKGGQLFCVHDSCVHRPRLIPGLEFRMFSLSVLFRSRSRTGAFRRRQRQRKKHVEEVRHDILPLQQRFHNGSPITGGELLRNQDEDGRKCIFKDISLPGGNFASWTRISSTDPTQQWRDKTSTFSAGALEILVPDEH